MLVLFWGGLLVMRMIVPMLGDGAGARRPPGKVMLLLGVVTVAGFMLDQSIHGRF